MEIRFTYDLNGILEVETTILATGKKAAMVIERTPGHMSKDAIAKAREAACLTERSGSFVAASARAAFAAVHSRGRLQPIPG